MRRRQSGKEERHGDLASQPRRDRREGVAPLLRQPHRLRRPLRLDDAVRDLLLLRLLVLPRVLHADGPAGDAVRGGDAPLVERGPHPTPAPEHGSGGALHHPHADDAPLRGGEAAGDDRAPRHLSLERPRDRAREVPRRGRALPRDGAGGDGGPGSHLEIRPEPAGLEAGPDRRSRCLFARLQLHRHGYLRLHPHPQPDRRRHPLLLPLPRHVDTGVGGGPDGEPDDEGGGLSRGDHPPRGPRQGHRRPQGHRLLFECHRLRDLPRPPVGGEPALEGVSAMNAFKKLLDLLAPLGFVVIVGALAWQRLGRTLPGGLRPWLAGGAALVVLHLVLRWEDVARGLGRRQMRYGTNTAVLSLVVLGILGAVNYLVVRHTARFDLTANKRYSLSDQTRKIVSSLKDEVKITYFQRSREMGPGPDRLKEYQALSGRLKIEYVDPVKSPAKAQALDVRGPWPILVVERGDRRERATNDSEQDITNALIKVTREGKKTVCLAEGEGERSGEDSSERGLSGAKTALGKSQDETKNVLLLREKTVPAECTVLIVAGPEKDLLPEATAAIRSYVKGGGRALLMVEPELRESYPNLDALPLPPDHKGLQVDDGLPQGREHGSGEGGDRGRLRPEPRPDLGAVLGR